MLSDLLTSSRGPGVIGTLLALIVLVGFGTLMMVASDNSKGSGLGAKIKEKKGAIRALKGQGEHWKTAAVEYDARRKQLGKLESLQHKVKRQLNHISDRKTEVSSAKDDLAKMNERFEDYKKKYRIAERARAAGEKMAELKTKDGKVYEQVKVLEINAIGMKIMHKAGNTRVHYKRLSDELQDRFQFTEEGAQVIAKREAANVATSVKRAHGYHKAVKIRDLKHKIRVHRENIGKWKSKSSSLGSQITSNDRVEKAAMDSASQYRAAYARGSRGFTMDNAKKAERKAASYRSRSAAARREISSLARQSEEASRAITSLQKELAKESAK